MSKKITKSPAPSITQLLEKLEQVVAWFESDQFDLEDALKKYKEAEELAELIEKRLSSVKNRVDVLKQSFSE